MRRRRLSPEVDDDRCTRNDGKGWRCASARLAGSRLCEKHVLYRSRKTKSARAVKEETAGKGGATKGENTRSKRTVKQEPVEVAAGEVRGKRAPARVSNPPSKKRRVKAEPPDPVAKQEKPLNPLFGGSDGASVMALGQIWAYPYESDGFPRSYARIDRIFPTRSVVQVTPLEFKPLDADENKWAQKGLPFACGVFQASSSTLFKDVSVFSHQVRCELQGDWDLNEIGLPVGTLYKIFPRRGEVWALYEQVDPVEGKCDFKLVEMVTSFDELGGFVTVFGLEKVKGKDGVYRRYLHKGFFQFRKFKRREFLKFSHQVPAVKVEEGGNEECWKVTLH